MILKLTKTNLKFETLQFTVHYLVPLGATATADSPDSGE